MEKIRELDGIPQYVQRSAEWFEQRKDKLTSSDAATALGLNPYQSREELLFKKCGVNNVFVGNVATEYGQKYESEAIRMYEMAMGKKNHEYGLICYGSVVGKCCFEDWCVGLEFLAGSPDGVAEDVRGVEDLLLLEVKCPFRRRIVLGEVPEYYYPQVQLNMFILGLKKADYIEYRPPMFGKEMVLNIVRVGLDLDWVRENVKVLGEFWKEWRYWKEVGIENHPRYGYYKFKETQSLNKKLKI